MIPGSWNPSNRVSKFRLYSRPVMLPFSDKLWRSRRKPRLRDITRMWQTSPFGVWCVRSYSQEAQAHAKATGHINFG